MLKLKQVQKDQRLPSSHPLFSRLNFTKEESRKGQQVDEDAVNDEEQSLVDDEINVEAVKKPGDVEDGGAGGNWLESDDIEDF